MQTAQIGTAKLTYGGSQISTLMADRLHAIMTEAIRLLGTLGHGPVLQLQHIGTYAPKSRLPGGGPSEHACNPPRAIDVAFVKWDDGTACHSQDIQAKPALHLQVEACLRLAGFGVVLGAAYNRDHLNHWHCDYSQAFGANPSADSVQGFVRRCLAQLGHASLPEYQKAAGLEADGAAGPLTLGALCKAIIGPAIPAQPMVVDWEGAGELPWVKVGEQAYVPLRKLAEGLGLAVDVSQYPRIGVGRAAG